MASKPMVMGAVRTKGRDRTLPAHQARRNRRAMLMRVPVRSHGAILALAILGGGCGKDVTGINLVIDYPERLGSVAVEGFDGDKGTQLFAPRTFDLPAATSERGRGNVVIVLPDGRAGMLIRLEVRSPPDVVAFEGDDTVLIDRGQLVEAFVQLMERPAECGNGRLEGDETCDDGNMIAGDGCDDLCRDEPHRRDAGIDASVEAGIDVGHPVDVGFDAGRDAGVDAHSDDAGDVDGLDAEPAEAAVDSGVATCGDGVVDVNEACDDGGRAISDGCSDLCQIEPGYLCAGTRSICRMIASTALVDHAAAHCPASGDGSTRRPFCTIEEGLLSHRATVLVMPGTYNEALIVDSGTTELHAAGAVELDGDMQIALTIGGGATVEVHSFTIRSRVTAVLIHNRNTIARLFDNYIGPSLNFGVDVKNNTDVTFERNRIEQCLGGGIKLDTAVAYRAVNNVVVRNGTDTSEFGGFYVKRIAAQATLTNNTIVGNTSSPMQAAGVRCNHRTVAVINSIIWANLSGTVPSTTDSNCATTYCDVGPTPSQPAHATDFTMAPDFRLDDSYRLNSSSPCRDRGDPAGIEPNGPAPPRDFDHQLRNDARVDVGADEFGL